MSGCAFLCTPPDSLPLAEPMKLKKFEAELEKPISDPDAFAVDAVLKKWAKTIEGSAVELVVRAQLAYATGAFEAAKELLTSVLAVPAFLRLVVCSSLGFTCY